MYTRICTVVFYVLWLMTAHSTHVYGGVSAPSLSCGEDTVARAADTVADTTAQGAPSVKKGNLMGFIENASKFFVPDSSRRKKVTFLAIPEFSYSDDSGLGIGATGRIYINNFNPLPSGEKRRQSYIDASFDVSFEGDMSFSVSPEFYINQDKLMLRGYFGYGHYPSSFWGIGHNTTDDMEEEYDKDNILFRAIVYKRLFHHMYIGGGYHYYDYGVSGVEEGGLLDGGDILGSDGCKVSGVSVHFMYDTRDYQFIPMKGVYVQTDGYYNFKAMGSTFNFSKHLIDVRYYLPTGENSVLAFNWYSQICIGDVPFQEMNGISNGVHSRGYPTKRYIDKDLASIQAEYRYYVGRFGLAAFTSFAGVGDDFIKALQMNKVSVGGGLRFKIFRSQRMYFRGDVGINMKGEMQLYFGIDELF